MMMIPKWADQQTVQTVTNPLALNTFAKIMITKHLMKNATLIRITVRRWKLKELLTLKIPFKNSSYILHLSLPEDYIKHKQELISDEGPFLQTFGWDSPEGSLYWGLIGFQKTKERKKYQQDIKEIMETKSTN